jgi:hypothetical protein
VLSLLLIACQPFGPIQSRQLIDSGAPFDPDRPLLVEPTTLDFGSVVVNELGAQPPTLSISVTNLSQSTAPVYGYTDIGDGVFAVAAEPYVVLDAGEALTLSVSFAPRTAEEYAASFTIVGGTAPVKLSGRGLAPVIDLDSDEPAVVPVGCEEDFAASITNRGDLPLTVSSAALRDGRDYALIDPPQWPMVLDVGERLELDVRFAPVFSWSDSSEREDAIVVTSDDPLASEVRQSFDVQPAWSPEVESELTYYPDTMTDLVVMVDNTGTMSSRLQLAEDALPVLVETLLDANVDIHATVVTGDSACPAGGFIDASASEEELLGSLSDGLGGLSGSGSGALLQHAEEVIEQSVMGGCLEGFLRQNALLHVLVISGSDDSSGESLSTQLSAIRGAAPLADGHTVSALVGTDPGGCMGLSYGSTYLSAALSTGGIQASACSDDWSSAMEEIALISARRAAGGMSMTLSPPPIPETLQVTVGGALYTAWSYDADTAQLSFPEEESPSTGSAVELLYLMLTECID